MTAEPKRSIESNSMSVEGFEDVFVEVDDQGTIHTGSPDADGLKLSEASDKYGVTERTIQRWIKEGRLLAHKIEGPYGPEWRVTGECTTPEITPGQGTTQGRQTVDIDMSNTVDHLSETVGNLTRLVENLSGQLKEAAGSLQGANYRIGYLESQGEVLRGQIKLLPDLQSKAEKTVILESEIEELRRQAERAKELEDKLLAAKVKESLYADMQRELEELKTEKTAKEEEERKGFMAWFLGKKK